MMDLVETTPFLYAPKGMAYDLLFATAATYAKAVIKTNGPEQTHLAKSTAK